MTMEQATELRASIVVIPNIEHVLKANITPYEKLVLIQKHIQNWRESSGDPIEIEE